MWVNSKKGNATIQKFFEETKHFTGIYRLKTDAKQKLLTIIMQYFKTINQYYQHIFRLWEYAETLINNWINDFIRILQSLIFGLLFGRRYTNIKKLLKKAKNIRNIRKNIISNFLKQEKFAILKFNLRLNLQRFTKKFIRSAMRFSRSALKSMATKKDFAGARSSIKAN